MRSTILIADAESSVRTILQQMLELEGYDVIEAASGEQALALAHTLQVDAFILDIEMPRMNGVDLCRALRGMEKYRSTPILFHTGNDETAVLDAAFAAGADDFINKPYNATAVKARLKSHLKRAEY